MPKFEIVKALESNEELLSLYDIDRETLNQQILAYETKEKYYMTLSEFFNFLQKHYKVES